MIEVRRMKRGEKRTLEPGGGSWKKRAEERDTSYLGVSTSRERVAKSSEHDEQQAAEAGCFRGRAGRRALLTVHEKPGACMKRTEGTAAGKVGGAESAWIPQVDTQRAVSEEALCVCVGKAKRFRRTAGELEPRLCVCEGDVGLVSGEDRGSSCQSARGALTPTQQCIVWGGFRQRHKLHKTDRSDLDGQGLGPVESRCWQRASQGVRQVHREPKLVCERTRRPGRRGGKGLSLFGAPCSLGA